MIEIAWRGLNYEVLHDSLPISGAELSMLEIDTTRAQRPTSTRIIILWKGTMDRFLSASPLRQTSQSCDADACFTNVVLLIPRPGSAYHSSRHPSAGIWTAPVAVPGPQSRSPSPQSAESADPTAETD